MYAETVPDSGVSPLDGGVDIDWSVGNRHVQVFIGNSEPDDSFIFRAETQGKRVGYRETIRNPNGAKLADALRWLTGVA